jgi:hypothetical protein
MSTRCRAAAAVLVGFLFAALAVAGPASAATTPAPSGSSSAPAKVAPAPPANSAAFGIQPATAKATDNRTEIIDSAGPGAKLPIDHVALVNIGTKTLTVDLYATDAVSTSDGKFTLAEATAKPTSVGAWVKVDAPSKVTLPPRTSKGPSVTIVAFHVSVPANASPGDHAGGIVVSLESTVSAGKSGQVKQHLDQRVGTRVYIRVSGPIHPALTVDHFGASFGPTSATFNPIGSGHVTMTYQVHNTGNVILSATQAASVSGWIGGGGHATGLAAIPELLPGASVSVTATVSGVYPGIRLTAHVALQPKGQLGAYDPGIVSSSSRVSLWAIPWTVLVIVLIVIFGVGYLAWRRWKPRSPKGDTGAHSPNRVKPPVAVG